MQTEPLSVGELTRYLDELFSSDELLSDIWIEGEVIESMVSRAGHCYFTIADADTKLKCVMFRGALQRQTYLPVVGQSCAAHGAISIYAPQGQYQLRSDFARTAGIGLAALEFELLKQQLSAEGLFDPARKRPLPFRIRTVGLVTSAEGAVRYDIETVLQRRNPFVHLILAPSAVQGESAALTLRAALQTLIQDGRSDIIIIGRGGGSASDLSAFNDESLVRAVFASPIPVISAVGHESDWTLLDLVADLRAATPSAAAEIASMHAASQMQQFSTELVRQQMSFRRSLATWSLDIDARRAGLVRQGPLARLSAWRDEVESLNRTLGLQGSGMVFQRAERVSIASGVVALAVNQALVVSRNAQERFSALLDVLNPEATLERGYAVLEDVQSGLPVRSKWDIHAGQFMTAQMRDGSIGVRVDLAG